MLRVSLAILVTFAAFGVLLFGLRSRRTSWPEAPATVTSQGTTPNGRRAGWTYTHPEPVLVTRAGVAWASIDVTVAEEGVTFSDEASGGLLRRRTIYVLGPEGDGPLRRLKTDHDGRIRCTLATGDYRFRLEPVGIEITTNYQGMPTSLDPSHTVPFTWTSEGPAVSEVRL